MQHANLAADIERAYRNKLPLIQKQALDAWYNAARRFNRYQTSGNSKEFNILLEKIEKFTKKK